MNHFDPSHLNCNKALARQTVIDALRKDNYSLLEDVLKDLRYIYRILVWSSVFVVPALGIIYGFIIAGY